MKIPKVPLFLFAFGVWFAAQGICNQANFVCGTPDRSVAALLKRSAQPGSMQPKAIKVMFVRADYPDNPWRQDSALMMAAADSVSRFFKDNSYGAIQFEFSLHPKTLMTPNEFEYYNTEMGGSIETFLSSSFKSEGYKIDDSNFVAGVFPYSGKIYWGGKYDHRKVYINGSITPRVLAHELGHAFGFRHAAALEEGGQVLGEIGGFVEYGDIYDVMGSSELTGHFNAIWKKQAGWLADSEAQKVEQSGLYRIYAHDNPTKGKGPMAIYIPANFNRVWPSEFWIEYRVSFDLESYNPRKGASVRLNKYWYDKAVVMERSASHTLLLDMTPASSLVYDFNDAALEVGETFSDSAVNFSLNVKAVNTDIWDENGWVEVEVIIDDQPVAARSRTAPPLITVRPHHRQGLEIRWSKEGCKPPDVAYKIADVANKTIAKGRLSPDREIHHLPLPHIPLGVYIFSAAFPATGLRINKRVIIGN